MFLKYFLIFIFRIVTLRLPLAASSDNIYSTHKIIIKIYKLYKLLVTRYTYLENMLIISVNRIVL